jgi:hypothetical protein
MARTNHAINLEENSIILYKLIYHLSERELIILKQYFIENEKKNWIRKSKSPAEISILFMPKKNKNLQLYVDYRSLNKLPVKNKHALFLIEEFIDKLSDTAIYIKLNIKNIYYKIRIRSDDK